MLASNAKHNQMVKKAFKPVLQRNYETCLKDVLTRWHRLKDEVNEKKLKKKQIIIEEELASVSAMKNDKNDVIFNQEQKHMETVKS